jgi:hypothetical protein
VNEHDAPSRQQCVRCGHTLPDLASAVALEDSDGAQLWACDVGCLAEVVTALAGRGSGAQDAVRESAHG